MVTGTVDRLGWLDGAVNNAGIAGSVFTPPADIAEENWLATINTNLNAVFMSMKFEIPVMLASGDGTIVKFAYMAGTCGGDIGSAT